MRIAIIGSGIAGLGCAYFLHKRHDVTLFEQNDYVGGHTNTVEVEGPEGRIQIDTGFMVYNEITYPLLTRLFKVLRVETMPTSMSFSVQHVPEKLEFCGSSLNHLFAQRSNLFRLRYWKFLHQINRFNKEALLGMATLCPEETVAGYVANQKYGNDFLEWYLIPMSSAIWSMPPHRMAEFPALTLLRFFYNHGFLGLHSQHPWRTVKGGAVSYVRSILQRLGTFLTGAKVNKIQRESKGVVVNYSEGRSQTFDRVVIATHADQALALLEEPSWIEKKLLGAFSYQPNYAILHTDDCVMPKNTQCWASWNYRVDGNASPLAGSTTTYWMNSLQKVSRSQNYFITIDQSCRIPLPKVLRQVHYRHPIFSADAIQAQKSLDQLNNSGNPIAFCGSYFGFGFHEDALKAGIAAARTISNQESSWQL